MNESNLINSILVLDCPKCANSHLYALNVQTSTWMGESFIPASPLKFTRLFTCPDTGEDFQVSMHLMQPHGIDYDEIIVRGVAQVQIDIQDLPEPTDFYKRFGLIEKFKYQGIRDSDMRIPPEGVECSGYRILGVYQA